MNNNFNLSQDVIDAIKLGKKINAIKLLRDSQGVNLKEAKDIVDSYCLEHRISPSTSTGESGSGMKWQSKIFFIWVLVFFPLGFYTFQTQNELALDSLLYMLAFMGCIITFDLIRDSYFSIISKSWPTTKSIIQESNIRYSSGRSGSSSGSNPAYIANFKIEYIVRGQKYEYCFKNPNPPRNRTEEKAKDYVKSVESGKIFPLVYYNINKPSQSYIDPGLKIHHFLGIPMGVAMFFIPLLTIYDYIKW